MAGGFLPRRWLWPPLSRLLRCGAAYLVMLAWGEELLLSGLLVPRLLAWQAGITRVAWIALGVGLFVVDHPWAGRLWSPQGRQLFDRSPFQIEGTLMGLPCALGCVFSGGLAWPGQIRGLAVLVWLEPLQGHQRLQLRQGHC